MIVGTKDAGKLFGISVIVCCAVLVCALFLNFYFDIAEIEDLIESEQAAIFYKAQVSTAKVVCYVSGGCLLITSFIMLFYYIKHYIDTHKKELGILKALGYSNIAIAKSFWIFGISVLIGALIGISIAIALMPRFYELQNKDNILPKITIGFHPTIFIFFVLLPTVVFSLISICYACIKLKGSALTLLKESYWTSARSEKIPKADKSNDTFLNYLRKSTLGTKKSLVFFTVFASFCFSAMTQMSFSMKDLSSQMMGFLILAIGLTLALVTLFLSLSNVIRGNRKTIAMMRVFGYSQRECARSILGGYRPMSYVGFALGTVYQYALLRIMVDIVFRDISVPEYRFDFPMMVLSLAVFVCFYETVMFCYYKKINKISIKEIMLE